MTVLNLLNFLERTLARQHDKVAAEFARKLHTTGAGDGHLRRGMNREVGREPADQPANADILHDGRVHSGGDDGAQILLGLGHLVGEHERVEGDVALDAAPMEELHQLRQVGLGEIPRAHPGVELSQAEVDRIGAVLDGSFRTFPIAGRGEQLRNGERGARRAE